MKWIVGLGNPGSEYDETRHNVGWWLLDRLAYDWGFGTFRKEGRALVASGRVGDERVRLLKPTTFMNRSGAAIAALRGQDGFVPADDLLVVVDDAAIDVAKIRFRPSGSAGGHNGLKSIEQVLGTKEYGRLRIGVGRCPAGVDLADWVLEPMPDEDEERVLQLLPGLTEAVTSWVTEGMQATMSRFN